MPHDHSPALRAFVLIARHGSFTRASREIGVTASALSQTLAQFERQLGVRLLARTTRRVGLTEAGRAFLERIAPALGVIDDAVDSARQYGERPAGTLRITAAMGSILAPHLAAFIAAYPEITLEINVDSALSDLVAQAFDAGIRLGERLEKDMIAVPLGGPMRSVGRVRLRISNATGNPNTRATCRSTTAHASASPAAASTTGSSRIRPARSADAGSRSKWAAT